MTLHSRFQSLCLQLAVCAGPVSAQNYDGESVSGSKEYSAPKLTDHQSDVAWWKKRWDGCRTGGQREEVVDELERYISGLRRRHGTEETDAQDRYWLIQEYEGIDARLVAEQTKFSLERVKELRRVAGRTVEFGKVKVR